VVVLVLAPAMLPAVLRLEVFVIIVVSVSVSCLSIMIRFDAVCISFVPAFGTTTKPCEYSTARYV